MTATERRVVVVERELAASPEKLWRALTQPHLMEEWLMQTDFAPAIGHRFTLRRDPAPGVSVVIACEVVTLEPHKTLSYTWSAYGLDSVVTFTLTPTAGGTLLRVEQDGFPLEQQAAYKGARAAWPQMLAALDALLARID